MWLYVFVYVSIRADWYVNMARSATLVLAWPLQGNLPQHKFGRNIASVAETVRMRPMILLPERLLASAPCSRFALATRFRGGGWRGLARYRTRAGRAPRLFTALVGTPALASPHATQDAQDDRTPHRTGLNQQADTAGRSPPARWSNLASTGRREDEQFRRPSLEHLVQSGRGSTSLARWRSNRIHFPGRAHEPSRHPHQLTLRAP